MHAYKSAHTCSLKPAADAHAHTHTPTPKLHGNFTLRRQLLFRPRFICHSLHRGQRAVYKRCSFCSLSCKKKTHLGQLITAQVPEHGHFWGIKVSSLIASLDFFCVWGCSGADPGRGRATSSRAAVRVFGHTGGQKLDRRSGTNQSGRCYITDFVNGM